MAYIYVKGDFTLVELPNMNTALESFDAAEEFFTAARNEDGFGMVRVLRNNIPEFNELCKTENYHTIRDILIGWLEYSEKNNEEEGE